MFNIGMMELVLVLVVAFLVVGPKDLPRVARWIARQVKKIRSFVREVKKETGWDEFSKEFKETGDDLKRTMKEADVSSELKDAAREVRAGVEDVKSTVDDTARTIREDAQA